MRAVFVHWQEKRPEKARMHAAEPLFSAVRVIVSKRCTSNQWLQQHRGLRRSPAASTEAAGCAQGTALTSYASTKSRVSCVPSSVLLCSLLARMKARLRPRLLCMMTVMCANDARTGSATGRGRGRAGRGHQGAAAQAAPLRRRGRRAYKAIHGYRAPDTEISAASCTRVLVCTVRGPQSARTCRCHVSRVLLDARPQLRLGERGGRGLPLVVGQRLGRLYARRRCKGEVGVQRCPVNAAAPRRQGP